MQGRDMVLPEDIQAVGVAVIAHRLGEDVESTTESGRALAEGLLQDVPIP
jgi:hypothetical protein